MMQTMNIALYMASYTEETPETSKKVIPPSEVEKKQISETDIKEDSEVNEDA